MMASVGCFASESSPFSGERAGFNGEKVIENEKSQFFE
jgi:hypothetical protein